MADGAAAAVVLHLFVTGETPRSQRARVNLVRLCESRLAGRYELRVTDVLRAPDAAEAARVLATPTVLRLHPGPARRVIGDLSDERRVLDGLELEGLTES
jgi:circadian clock protein KaiB